MQVNENTELLVKFRDNILQILNTMNSMQVCQHPPGCKSNFMLGSDIACPLPMNPTSTGLLSRGRAGRVKHAAGCAVCRE